MWKHKAIKGVCRVKLASITDTEKKNRKSQLLQKVI